MLNKLGRNDLCWCGSQKNIRSVMQSLMTKLNYISYKDILSRQEI
ncbi:SEC-C metal-binding domain-containing protein [Gottschalkia purinilytica]